MSATKHSDQTDQILELLTSNPTGDEVARALALDYLLPFSATKIRITSVSSDDTLHFLGDYGWAPSTTHSEEKSEVWRKRTDSIRDVKINGDFFGTNPDRTTAAALLKIRGVTTGALVMHFHEPLSKALIEELEAVLTHIVKPLALFFFIHPTFNPDSSNETPVANHVGAFTVRQLKILQAMSTGRTNHQIAIDLGFSVSTIRHESMRIYELLSVSDRQEAARKAKSLGIL